MAVVEETVVVVPVETMGAGVEGEGEGLRPGHRGSKERERETTRRMIDLVFSGVPREKYYIVEDSF